MEIFDKVRDFYGARSALSTGREEGSEGLTLDKRCPTGGG